MPDKKKKKSVHHAVGYPRHSASMVPLATRLLVIVMLGSHKSGYVKVAGYKALANTPYQSVSTSITFMESHSYFRDREICHMRRHITGIRHIFK